MCPTTAAAAAAAPIPNRPPRGRPPSRRGPGPGRPSPFTVLPSMGPQPVPGRPNKHGRSRVWQVLPHPFPPHVFVPVLHPRAPTSPQLSAGLCASHTPPSPLPPPCPGPTASPRLFPCSPRLPPAVHDPPRPRVGGPFPPAPPHPSPVEAHMWGSHRLNLFGRPLARAGLLPFIPSGFRTPRQSYPKDASGLCVRTSQYHRDQRR